MAEAVKGLATVLGVLDRATCLTIDQVAEAAEITNKDVARMIGKLIGRGLADRKERGCYQLTAEGAAFRASGKEFRPGVYKRTARHWRPRPNSLRDRLWKAMRIKGKATIPELLELAASSDKERTKVAQDGAWRYIAALTKVGILRELPRRSPGTALTSNGFGRWQLVNDLGPVAPQLRKKATEVYDPNGDVAYPLPVSTIRGEQGTVIAADEVAGAQ